MCSLTHFSASPQLNRQQAAEIMNNMSRAFLSLCKYQEMI